MLQAFSSQDEDVAWPAEKAVVVCVGRLEFLLEFFEFILHAFMPNSKNFVNVHKLLAAKLLPG